MCCVVVVLIAFEVEELRVCVVVVVFGRCALVCLWGRDFFF